MTRRLKEAVEAMQLTHIFTGSLSKVPGNLYTRAKPLLFKDDLAGLPTGPEDDYWFIQFKHWEPDITAWSVWQTPRMSYREAMDINKKELSKKGRPLWDSFQMYGLVDGEPYLVLGEPYCVLG